MRSLKQREKDQLLAISQLLGATNTPHFLAKEEEKLSAMFNTQMLP